MKKTILLLVTVLLVGTSFAQFNNKQTGGNNDYAYNKGRDEKFDSRFDKTYFFTAKERDMQIAQVNKEYTRQIKAVKTKFFFNRMAKERQVKMLEQKRDKEIGLIWMKYNDKNNKGDDRGGKGRGKW